MNGNWSRLKRELPKIGLHDLAAVVIEASMDDVSKGRYRSEMKPHAALQSIFAIRSDIECPSFGPGKWAGAEFVMLSLLEKYLAEIQN
jgi:hypothetical protein